ncbi:hypothetical protein N0V93_003344 [Gnomoniopsis smithogilvyi]|uniref:Uncharacterized protein n=1 Tax=Gnomoniopsis smithogilvyi TaxID=1191159 RepID=A0A9W8YWX9_9PEZI|nr:hypothetical protein N0V93_003344 [Gnomoniopsis smithogilvyi]
MATTIQTLTRTGSWFKPELRTKDYTSLGDVYEDSKYNELAAKKWNVEPQSKTDNYLKLVKQASQRKWIHLRLLADFMQIGRIPRDWAGLGSIPLAEREQAWRRTNICILDYHKDKKPAKRFVENHKGEGLTTEDLKSELRIGATEHASFRLYVVEDLSRNVIEALGSEFQISPEFFRAHIADYAWYNVRDRWREPQPLEVVRNQRNWFQIRYVTTRYFATKEKQAASVEGGGCFETALEEAKSFNIFRRPDDDKSRGWWDSEDAVVALTRSRATFWYRPKDSVNGTAIGVLLLDPTVSEGLPLWRGHRNFHPVPTTFEEFESDHSAWETSTYDKPQSFFEDFIYWAENPQVFSSRTDTPPEHTPILTLLHLVGAEWLTMCDYIKTRLNQVDLETVDPVHFAEKQHVDVALGKLHMWRRFIPLYREMISDTLQHVFDSPRSSCSGPMSSELASLSISGVTVATPGTTCPTNNSPQTAEKTNPTSHPGPVGDTSPGQGTLPTSEVHRGTNIKAASSSPSSIKAYEQDFRLVLKHLEEYQMRIDRLTSVVTAVMAVDDTRRAINDARNIGRLTWLATFFIPFSVVSGIFSMQDLSAIRLDTIWVYFATTLPLAIVTVAFAWALHSPVVRAWICRMW